MAETPSFYLTVVAFSFTTEDGEWDSPHKTENWRLEYYPEGGHFLPLENAIFGYLKRNEIMSDVLENKLLDAEENVKEGFVVDEVKRLLQPDVHFFAIETPSPFGHPRLVLISGQTSRQYHTQHSNHLKANLPDQIHSIVKYNGVPYLLKAANFPRDEVVLTQEVKNYRLVKQSKWIAELGGIVERQGRKEAVLVRYYSAGDLTRHFAADEIMKRR